MDIIIRFWPPQTSKQKLRKIKKNILKWLSLTFVNQIFSDSTDSVLQKIRNVLLERKKKSNLFPFPIKEIAEEFKSDTSKNYKLNDNILEDLIKKAKIDKPINLISTFFTIFWFRRKIFWFRTRSHASKICFRGFS